jgi:uncharacterized membrane protein
MSPGPESTNIQAVADIERQTREQRTAIERLADAVGRTASSPIFITVHVAWFTIWIVGNTVLGWNLDPYPFSLLTLAVALEAAILTGFVLMSQGRMTEQAEKRAHLDLQVNLLAEQELTAILRVVCRLAEQAGIDLNSCDPRIEQLLRPTDVHRLSSAVERELHTAGGSARDQPKILIQP